MRTSVVRTSTTRTSSSTNPGVTNISTSRSTTSTDAAGVTTSSSSHSTSQTTDPALAPNMSASQPNPQSNPQPNPQLNTQSNTQSNPQPTSQPNPQPPPQFSFFQPPSQPHPQSISFQYFPNLNSLPQFSSLRPTSQNIPQPALQSTTQSTPPARKTVSFDDMPESEPSSSDRNINEPEKKSVSECLANPEVVKIYVGPSKKCWVLNKELLCNRSQYFASAFGGQFKEAEEGVMILEEDDPGAFAQLVEFMYTGDLKCSQNQSDEWHSVSPCKNLEEKLWCKTYILADKIGMKSLATICRTRYRICTYPCQWVPDIDEVKCIYTSTMKGDPFRRQIMKTAARRLCSEQNDNKDVTWIMGMAAAVPEFQEDLLVHLVRSLQEAKHKQCDGAGCDGGNSWS